MLLVADARTVIANVNVLKARAKGISGGLEPELSAVVDVLFPIEAISESALEFRIRFPRTPLRLYVEALGGAYQPVIDGRCSLGIVGSLPDAPASMSVEPLPAVNMVMVAAHDHPLAAFSGLIPRSELEKHVQLVLTDRSELTRGKEFGVMSPLTWRLSDLFAKHSFLLKGLGWGGMPLHTVKKDLQDQKLVKLHIQDILEQNLSLPMFAVYMSAQPPGPAGRWLIERLKQCSTDRRPTGPDEIG
jgi:DNA-binding transcriptional LysR family regulator